MDDPLHRWIEEVHDYGLNVKEFSVTLAGVDKDYLGGDDDFSEPGVEYRMATRFIKNLRILSALDPRRPILIHMKTCGGDYVEGMAVYDAIRSCSNPVTILSYTHARSMSSIILQAARKRVLMPHSYFLFHEGTLALSGTHKGVITNAQWTRRVENPTMLAIYVERLKQKGKFSDWPKERIRQMLQDEMNKREDVFLTAKEAVEWGFADEIFGSSGRFDWDALCRQ